MSIFSKKKKVITHDGVFHADDVFATAALSLLLNGRMEVVRTRDQDQINEGDFVFDVGGEYDPALNRFDHHQPGGAGMRDNGIPYAAFGLVWKKYGETICGSKEVAEQIDMHLVQAIDAVDNGIDLATPTGVLLPFTVQNLFYAFRPSWKENPEVVDIGFTEAVEIAIKVLERKIIKTRDFLEGKKGVLDAYQTQENRQILVLDERYPWEEVLLEFPEPLFVVAPRVDGKWKAEAVFVRLGSFERRKYFPELWGGKKDQELAAISGVPDAVFCHNARFLVVALSREGALELARKALAS